MSYHLKESLKDNRLWIQSTLTVGLSALLAVVLNGALAAPATMGEPVTPTNPVSAATAALRDS